MPVDPPRQGAAFGLAVASGLVIALSLPPFGWWPLGVIGLGGFGLILHDRPARARATIGAGMGLGQYGVGLWWVTEFNAAGYVGLIVHGMACTALAAALVPARRRWGVLLGLPAALVTADWLRSHFPLGGLPIGGTALGQAGGPLVPAARLGGTLLVTGVAALAGSGLAALGRPLRPGADHGRTGHGRTGHARTGATNPWWQAAVALALVVALVAAGRLAPDGSGGGPPRTLVAAAVQGGGERGLHAVQTDPDTVFQRQLAATGAVHPPVDLVLWPEDVLQVDGPVGSSPKATDVAGLAVRLNATVVVGVVENEGANRFRNAAVAWGPSGTIVARYDKVHRVPFGEYVPGRSLIKHLVSLDLIPRDAIPGHGSGILDTPAAPLGTVISYEVFFEDRARGAIRAGGQLLVVPTNASSYRTSQVPTQEVAAARLRAWETGRDTVQAAPTGYSAIIDHRGRVLARSSLGSEQVLVHAVTLRTGQTVFVRFGDGPVLVVVLVGLAWAWWPLRRRRLLGR